MFSFWPFTQNQPVEEDSSVEGEELDEDTTNERLENDLQYLETDLNALSPEQRAIFQSSKNAIYWLISHSVIMLDFGPCEHIQIFNEKIEELRKNIYSIFKVDFVFPYPEGTFFSGWCQMCVLLLLLLFSNNFILHFSSFICAFSGNFGVILFDEGKMMYQPSSFLRDNILEDLIVMERDSHQMVQRQKQQRGEEEVGDSLEDQIEQGFGKKKSLYFLDICIWVSY